MFVVVGAWFSTSRFLIGLTFHFRHLIEVFRPVRRKRHHHVGPRTGQRPFFTQINIQIFPAQPLPLGEVLEGSVFFEFFQAAADATFPAQHRQFAGKAALGEFGEAGGALAADFPAFDQALVLAFPQFIAVQA